MIALAEAAVDLGRRGFRVHPLKAKDQPHTAYSRTATSIEADIAAFWRRWPDALIGICTGDGLVVIDDDNGHDDPDPELPATLTARTATRGWHYYYRCDLPIRNSVGKLAPGVDVRGQGGYVVAPPSEGRTWVDIDTPIAVLPDLLLAACLREEACARATFEPRAHVAAGERHDYLVRVAGWMLAVELVDSYADLRDLVLEHALDVCEPWAPEELPAVRKNIAGIVRWVLARERAER